METLFRSQDSVKNYLKSVARISSQWRFENGTTGTTISSESVEQFCELSTTEEKITLLINSAQNSDHANTARLISELLADMLEFTQDVEFPSDVRETSREMISNFIIPDVNTSLNNNTRTNPIGILGTLGTQGNIGVMGTQEAREHVPQYFPPHPTPSTLNMPTISIGQILEAPPLPRHTAIEFEPSPLTEEEDDTKACPVCHVHVKTHVLTCGHQYCSECCNFISREKKCPTCRKSVSHIIKFY